MRQITQIFFTFLLSITSVLQAKEVMITQSCGDAFITEIDSEAPFFDVLEQLNSYLLENDAQGEISVSYSMGMPSFKAKKVKAKQERVYAKGASSDDKQRIRYIITTLAKSNWLQLAREESSLKKAGDKIEHVHPYRFLETIFTDEEMKAALYAVRNKSLVWGDYYNGLRKSLSEEADKNNLEAYIDDFANRIRVDANTIRPLIQHKQWDVLIDTLINTIPRTGNPDRYNM